LAGGCERSDDKVTENVTENVTMIGETVGGYTIVERLGAGGMGEVFLAEHGRIDRRAAVKILLPEYSNKADAVHRFFTEARATSSIRHPGIVEVFDCDVHANGRVFIVMEALAGEGLGARLQRERAFGRDVSRALEIAGEIADALAAAHAKGIIHRDLKPDNVFLVPDPDAPSGTGLRVKVLDFGIAKLMQNRDGTLALRPRTRTGTIIGTPVYMSPEQCRGLRTLDLRTDIYALGCILFEILAGRPPFASAGLGELLSAHINDPPPSFASLGVPVPSPVESLVRKMLAKSPDQRPATMADVRRAIDAVRAALDVEPARPQVFDAVGPSSLEIGPTAPLRNPTTLSEIASETLPGLRPRYGLAAGVAALGLAIAVGVAWHHRSQTATPPTLTESSLPGAPSATTPAAPPATAPAAPSATAPAAPSATAPGAPTPVAPAAPPAVAPAARPGTVRIEVVGAPAGLTVTADGQPAELPLVLPRGPAKHTLRFAAAGHLPRTMTIDAATNRTINLTLEPLPRPLAGTRPKRDGQKDPATAPMTEDDESRKL
jgi:serine/threonine-protein kinase